MTGWIKVIARVIFAGTIIIIVGVISYIEGFSCGEKSRNDRAINAETCGKFFTENRAYFCEPEVKLALEKAGVEPWK